MNCGRDHELAWGRNSDEEARIACREAALRAWFTRDADPELAEIDGLEIGWGGVQRWATAQLALPARGRHLDVACGYATFLAQLGWRFPTLAMVGLNIDFAGPHAAAPSLLREAGVNAVLVRADAMEMPFRSGVFGSVSCFLGLQDIEIGFGDCGVRDSLSEAVRVLRADGLLVLLDEFAFPRLETWLAGLPVQVTLRAERCLEVRWSRPIAERALRLYAQGFVAQMRSDDQAARQRAFEEQLARARAEMERQLHGQGYYVPFGPLRLLLLRKLGTETLPCQRCLRDATGHPGLLGGTTSVVSGE